MDDSNVRTYADSLDDPPNSRLFLVTSKSTTDEVFIAQSRSSGSHRDVEDEELTRIFIMIPKTFTEEDLKEKFKEYGDIEYCIVIRNKTTGESKGLGYVRYLKPSQAAMAIENCDRNYRAILAEPKNRTSASCENDYFSTPRFDHMSHDPGMNSYPFAEAGNFGVNEIRGSDSITKCLLVSSRASLSQEQMFNLFDLIPGLDNCEMQRDPYGYNKGQALVRYNNVGSAVYAKEKLHGFEYPPGNRLVLTYIEDGEEKSSPVGMMALQLVTAQMMSMVWSSPVGQQLMKPNSCKESYDTSCKEMKPECSADVAEGVVKEVCRAKQPGKIAGVSMANQQRGHHLRTMSSEEKTLTPVHKTSTPTHKSGSSTSSHRDSRQCTVMLEGSDSSDSDVFLSDTMPDTESISLVKCTVMLEGSDSSDSDVFLSDTMPDTESISLVKIQKGKLHGSIDIGLSVMSIKKKARRIDLDTEEHIYHLKVKSQEVFDAWVSKLRHHRLYRQNEIVRSPRDAPFHMFPSPNAESAMNAAGSEGKTKPKTLPWQPPIPSTSSLPASYSNGQSKVAAWLQESEEMDKCAEELANCQSGLVELSRLLQNLEILQRTQSAPNFTDMQVFGCSLRHLRAVKVSNFLLKTFPTTDTVNVDIPLSASMTPVRLHSSNPNLCADLVDFQPPVSRLADTLECATDYIKLQEEFCLIAQKVHSLLKSAFNTVAIEKEKIKQLISEQELVGHTAQIMTLKRSLSQALTQNAELRTRLHRIHSESVLSEQVVSVNIIPSTDEPNEQIHISLPLTQQASNESRLSMSESVSEFFDAQEVLLSASSSENEGSDDESYVSDVSDNFSEDNASVADNRQIPNGDLAGGGFRNGRRTCLPAPSPDTSNINLWNILRNNIGKDLSKVSMPVELNEPLNTLQHLCEELEYTELLDKAAETEDPYERMILIAAFAVSGYSSTYYRAGSKPFNPVLGETYECIREDKGLCFFAEQVSHHPPISACHCESKKFTFWQDIRWKNKFWGKSMEILPIGIVNVALPKYGDHYEWNKVTTCIHNILSGTRWIEHYGEITIRNTKSFTDMHTDEGCYLQFLEEGNVEAATNEKQRIEDLQRSRRRYIEENNIEYQPRFFKKVIDANQREKWVTNNTYWELRKVPGFSTLENPQLW
ncbi:Oxysterol-binding protein-related protein 6 [Acipenser ruthenus]|uniref:Oxysterol-binding protein n=1 Tax=Acipenser ruthenus TaxID=7906 RepID=A0A444U591_ACIRT|nr:Oxysterol-binding protein-related protein 6 [Acipenser ruthenus]